MVTRIKRVYGTYCKWGNRALSVCICSTIVYANVDQAEAPSLLSSSSNAIDPRTVTFLNAGRLEWELTPIWDEHTLVEIKRLSEDQYSSAFRIGLPIEPYQRLVLRTNNGTLPISWPSDLKGRVTIEHKSQVLEFIGLFSSPSNKVRFPRYPYMALVKGELNDEGTYSAGRVPPGVFDDLGLWDTKVVGLDNEFRVYRTVAIVHWRKTRFELVGVALLEEIIHTDGSYFVQVLWEREVAQAELGVALPQYR